MNYTKLSCEEFVDILSSKEPVPGGGGASALCAAIGMALGNMVGSLTVGKKKYADVEDDMISLNERAKELEGELIELVAKDAEVFEPLSKAYSLPKETEEEKAYKDEVMEKCLFDACSVPIEIMRKCCEAIDVTEEYAAKGTKIALSDAGVSATVLGAALKGASLNVYINTGYMKNREVADQLEKEANEMLDVYTKKADEIFASVRSRL